MNPINFSIQQKLDGELGRAGILTTPHGAIETPAFVAVATKATIKGLTPEMLQDLGAQVVLANTYHLYLQPGSGLIEKMGGFGPWMGWHGPTMTDSGGFQVFSLGVAYGKELSKVVKPVDPSLQISERSHDLDKQPLARVGRDGVSFTSHLDGSVHYITPERSIEIQHQLGADMIFTFDECTSPQEPYAYQKESLERTHAWAKRCLDYHKNSPNASRQALFGIVQGGRHEDLRKESAQAIAAMGFDGFGIGGSFAKEDMSTAVGWVNAVLPEDKPRHLLGIGEPADLVMRVRNGVDLFDCVAPTRLGRTGAVHTKDGKLNLFNARFVEDMMPIEEGCACYTCTHFNRAYLSHLFRSKEMLAGTLASIHNLHFIYRLMADMRQAIFDGTFDALEAGFLSRYEKRVQ